MSSPPQKKIKLETTNEICPFGENCYRKNPIHFNELKHPHLETILNDLNGDLTQSLEKYNLKHSSEDVLIQLKLLKGIKEKSLPNAESSSSSSTTTTAKTPNTETIIEATNKSKFSNINEKIEASAPFRYFLTMIRSSKETHKEPLSIAFHQLLDPSLGALDSSLHITFMIEFNWILDIYDYHKLNKSPMLVLFGVEDPELKTNFLPSHIKGVFVKPPTIFGHHHTKMSILSYKDKSIRIIITTANLVSSDWENRTQGVWISPRCPPLSSTTSNIGESPTNFRQDLVKYLNSYNKPELKTWIDKIVACDFSEINVFLVASVPGSHEGMNMNSWGHRRLASLLKKHCENHENNNKKSTIVAQCSSIGTLGPKPESWLLGQLLHSLSESKKGHEIKPEMKLIYPSLNNVKSSYNGLAGGACLPYSQKTHNFQKWLEHYLLQWRSDSRHRTRAMPHIKTYTSFNGNLDKANYFLLTSANLSKAAWGMIRVSKSSTKLQILSYECGVLFLPQFVTKTPYFNINKCPLIPYDIPLKEYEKNDKVWVNEMMFGK